jgi:hypothetical protein
MSIGDSRIDEYWKFELLQIDELTRRLVFQHNGQPPIIQLNSKSFIKLRNSPKNNDFSAHKN